MEEMKHKTKEFGDSVESHDEQPGVGLSEDEMFGWNSPDNVGEGDK